MLSILGKKLTADEFRRFAKSYDYGKIRPDSLVIHHTWKPRKSEWKGDVSVEGLRKYYEGLGWGAGPHLFVAEDGIWLFTPLSDVGIHAGDGNAVWERLGKEYRGFRGPVGSKLKSYSIGIEVVGDYDAERWSGKTLENAMCAIATLRSVLGIPTEKVTFHRDWAQKTCPGSAITKEWLFAELAKRDSEGRVTAHVGEPEAWARDAWEWQRSLGLDLSVSPQERVDAQWVFAVMKKALETKE